MFKYQIVASVFKVHVNRNVNNGQSVFSGINISASVVLFNAAMFPQMNHDP